MRLKVGSVWLMIMPVLLLFAAVAMEVSLLWVENIHSTAASEEIIRARSRVAARLEQARAQLWDRRPLQRKGCSELQSSPALWPGLESTSIQGGLDQAPEGARLAQNMSASSTQLKLNTSRGVPMQGRLRINDEWIDFTGREGPYLLGLKRGRQGTLPSSHAEGSSVGLLGCHITAADRYIPESIEGHDYQEESWMTLPFAMILAADRKKTKAWVWRSEPSPHWDALEGLSARSPQDLCLLHSHEVWMVDDRNDSYRFSGERFWKIPGLPSEGRVTALACMASSDIWALFDNGQLWYYDQNRWRQGNSPRLKDMNTLSLWDANRDHIADFALIGGKDGTVARFMSGWIQEKIGTQTWNSSVCLGVNDGWLVGEQASFARLRNGRWSLGSFRIAGNYKKIWCNRDNDCWAVGQTPSNQGIAQHWNGARFEAVPLPSGTQGLESVSCHHAKDCWAIGVSGQLLHFDGQAWTRTGALPGIEGRSVVCLPIGSPKRAVALRRVL